MAAYTTKQLADMFCLHPNTIRLYERQGFISPAARSKNNYRIFGELHVVQVKICRRIFGYPFFNRRIRDTGNQVLFASANKDYVNGAVKVKAYSDSIADELAIACKAADILNEWAVTGKLKTGPWQPDSLSRVEAAKLLGTTKETVRNWERNNLVQAESGYDGRQRFDSTNIDKLHVIYMLRSAGYSMSAIHRCLIELEKGKQDPITILNNPDAEDVIMVGDRWVFELKRLQQAAAELPALFKAMKNC